MRHLAHLLAPGRPSHTSDQSHVRPRLDILFEAADRHNLVAALWSQLVVRGDVEPVPPSIRRFLQQRWPERATLLMAAAEAHATNAARTDDLIDQATAALLALTEVGVMVAPLKGIDALLCGRYVDPAARTMTDIDLLVHPSSASRAREVLGDLGYRTVEGSPANTHQLPPLVASQREGSIEIHTRLATSRWSHVIDPAQVLERSTPADDGTGWRLRRTDAALHLVVHAQLHDESHRLCLLPLRALHETALLLHRAEPVDWDEIDACFVRTDRRPALASHLCLTHALFAVESPLPIRRSTQVRAQAVIELDGRKRTGNVVTRMAYLPVALSNARMSELYSVHDRRSIAVARARHVVTVPARHWRAHRA